ncbi:hypothetical protein SESBI_14071 [Sesbania bispinosa]|nr:hypothetical protein SESBI_14071 [Sesbania bispinosa]
MDNVAGPILPQQMMNISYNSSMTVVNWNILKQAETNNFFRVTLTPNCVKPSDPIAMTITDQATSTTQSRSKNATAINIDFDQVINRRVPSNKPCVGRF